MSFICAFFEEMPFFNHHLCLVWCYNVVFTSQNAKKCQNLIKKTKKAEIPFPALQAYFN